MGYSTGIILFFLWKQEIQSAALTIVFPPDSRVNECSQPNPLYICRYRLRCPQIHSALIRQTAGRVAGGNLAAQTYHLVAALQIYVLSSSLRACV